MRRSRTKVDNDPLYWSVYEVVRDLYEFCQHYAEAGDYVVFQFNFPNPPELSDMLDSLTYFGVPFFYHRDGDLFVTRTPVRIEVRKSDLWRRMFRPNDGKRTVFADLALTARRSSKR